MKIMAISAVLSLLACSIGFKNYIWFISIGYGLAVAAIGIMLLIAGCSPLLAFLLIAYGLRLSGYLIYREVKTAYNSRMTGEIKQNKDVPMAGRIGIWLSSGVLYPLMCSPAVFRTVNQAEPDVCMYLGFLIGAAGIFIESLSDMQKQKAKKENPDRFVDTGLFRIVRCPNYLGELIMWTGVFVSGISVCHSTSQWICAVLGYLAIIYIMFSGARRLELRQNKRYFSDVVYRQYHDTVPILIPFLPLFSVEKYKWLVG